MKSSRAILKCLGLILAMGLLVTNGHTREPRERIFPHRPNPPGPNNPIGPNNPAVSNPLSSLNPTTPFSNNQIMLRQLLQSNTQNLTPNATNQLPTNTSYGFLSNNIPLASPYHPTIPANVQLLLNNRTAFSTSHPLIFERPDPLTPLTNNYAVINGRYFAISHDPANDPAFYQNGAHQIFVKTLQGKSIDLNPESPN